MGVCVCVFVCVCLSVENAEGGKDSMFTELMFWPSNSVEIFV